MVATEPRSARLPVVALLVANAISLLGTQMTVIAVPWFVLQTTGSAARTGITGFFSLLPVIIAGMLGGALVDRLGFTRASVLSDLASGLAVAAIPLLHRTVGLAFWQLLTLVFLRELCNAPGRTARQGLLPDLIALSGLGRERINATYQFVLNIVLLLGTPLAGMLIALLNPSDVLWLDAATFGASAAIVAALVSRRAISRPVAARTANYLGELAVGFRFLRQARLIRALALLGMALNALFAACFGIILPVQISRSQGQALDLGLVLAGFSGGTLLGTACYVAIAPRLPRRATFTVSFLLSALPLWVLVLTPPVWVMVAALAFMGMVNAPINPLVGTILQERIPADLRGRVFGLTTALITLAAPLGVLLTGLAIERIAIRAALATIAASYLLIALIIACLPALHDMAPPGDITDTDEVAEWTNSHHPALPLPRTGKNGADNGRLRGPQALRGG